MATYKKLLTSTDLDTKADVSNPTFTTRITTPQVRFTDGSATTFNHLNVAQWATAYGWGNHASAGYLTSTPTGTALTNIRSAVFDVSGGGDSIGTTDGQNFHIKTNSTYRISITSAGVISLLGVTKVASTMQFDGNQTIETVGGSDSLYINPHGNLQLGTSSTDHTYIGASGRNVTINSTTTTVAGQMNISSSTPFLYIGDGTSNNDGSWDVNLMMDSHHNSRLRLEQRNDNKNLELYVHGGVEPTIRATDSATTLRLGVGGNICFEMDAYSNYLRKATYVSILRADNTDGKITIHNQGYGGKGDLFARKVDASTFHLTNNTTNNTAKNGVITHSQYASDTETEGFLMMSGFSNSTTNRIDLGGGNSQHNAVEEIRFFTASNSTTATGTQRMSINGSGTATFSGDAFIHKVTPQLEVKDTSNDVRGYIGINNGVLKVGTKDNANFVLQSNGTNRVTIASNGASTFNGNVTIGSSSLADGTLKIESSSSGDPKLQFASTDKRIGIMDFVEDGTLQGSIVYDHNGDNLKFATGSANRTARLTVNETTSTFTSNLTVSGDITIAKSSGAGTLDIKGASGEVGRLRLTADAGANATDVAYIVKSNGGNLYLGNSSTATTEHLSIDTSGNVGDRKSVV